MNNSIHPGQIVTEVLKLYDKGERGIIKLPYLFQMEIVDSRAATYQKAQEIQSYCSHYL